MDQGGVGFCILRDGKHQQQPQQHLANLPISNISQHTQHISRESFHPALPFPPQPALLPTASSLPLSGVCVCRTRQPGRGRRTPPTRETSRPAEEDAREPSSLGESIAGAVPLKQSRGRGSAGFPREWEMFRNGLPPRRAQSHAAGRAVGPLFVVDEPPIQAANKLERTDEPTPVPAPA